MEKITLVQFEDKFVPAKPVDISGANKDTLVVRTQAHGDMLVNLEAAQKGEPTGIVIDNGTGMLMRIL